MNRTFPILLAFLLAPLAMLHAASYHLDAEGGTDDGDGLTPATAWRSLAKASAFTFQPGDRLLLKAGSSWTGQLHPLGSGSAEHRITLDRHGKGAKPVIHGGGIASGAVLLENQERWSIRNLKVTNQGSPAPKKMGILIRNNAVGTLSGIEVKDCDIHDVVGDLADYRDGKESGGIVFCEDVIFQSNEVCETKTKFDGMAFDFDNSNQRCIYQYNYSHDNEGGFLNMCCDGKANGNIVRYNVSQNDGCLAGSRVFLVHGHGNHNYQVYNNTIYVRNGNPAMFEQGADSSESLITFQNNIFINAGSGTFLAPKGCQFERNLYFGSGHIEADGKKILADPRLPSPGSGRIGLDSVDGYKLVAGSPALDAGVLIKDNGGRDYWGKAVSATASSHLGAFNGRAIQR